ncbi:MAG TPA: hypothetical protein VMM18_04475 [Gemmatimonadaceae bacterium]|nr:hypothetical protein [Gemmatimonadaceae bacterium]
MTARASLAVMIVPSSEAPDRRRRPRAAALGGRARGGAGEAGVVDAVAVPGR